MTLVIADDLRPGANWITFDPAWIYEINAAAGMCLNYEPLYDLPDSTKPDQFTPLIAADFPQISEDGMVATIPLRSGVKFHSGNEMTADDFVFSWNRLKNVKFQPSFLATDYWDSVEAVDPLDAQNQPQVAERSARCDPDLPAIVCLRQQVDQGERWH